MASSVARSQLIDKEAAKDVVRTSTGRARESCIYPNLKLRIYAIGMRQKHLARLAGIDEAYLSRIINGNRVPGDQIRLKIAKVLGSDVEWLFQEATLESTEAMLTKILGPC